MNTPWWAKLVIGMVMVSGTIVSSIWGGFELLDLRMDKKVEKGREEVIHIITTLRDERNALMRAQEEKTEAKFGLILVQMGEMRSDIRSLYAIGKSIDRKVTLQNPEEKPYTITHKSEKKEGKEL